MPRSKSIRGKTRMPEMQTYIFEIKTWDPEYSWSVNQDRFRDCPYREYLTLEFRTTCVFPQKLVGRDARVFLVADRDGFDPSEFQRDPEWRPKFVGLLTLRPNDSEFYMRVPQESFGALLTALAHGLFRFIDLYGPALRYGKSECSSFRFVRSVNLDDY